MKSAGVRAGACVSERLAGADSVRALVYDDSPRAGFPGYSVNLQYGLLCNGCFLTRYCVLSSH